MTYGFVFVIINDYILCELQTWVPYIILINIGLQNG